MSRLEGISARIALSVLVCAWSPTRAAMPPASAPHLPQPKAFVDSLQSGELDAENFDFAGAGFFDLSPQERMQWQGGVFGALSPIFLPGFQQCTPIAHRSGIGLAWVQIAGQSANAGEWQNTVRPVRAHIAEIDQMLNRISPASASADPVVRELMDRYARDQAVRSVFEQLKWTEGLSPVAANNWLLVMNSRMEMVDCDNTAWLKEQVAKVGWFTISKYGADVDAAAWHLVQHADREPSFQREMLTKLQALPRGQTDGRRLAMLFDRVARAEGHLQRYATQGQCKDGQWTPYESEAPERLDERRAAVGMEPIAELMKFNSREACPH